MAANACRYVCGSLSCVSITGIGKKNACFNIYSLKEAMFAGNRLVYICIAFDSFPIVIPSGSSRKKE